MAKKEEKKKKEVWLKRIERVRLHGFLHRKGLQVKQGQGGPVGTGTMDTTTLNLVGRAKKTLKVRGIEKKFHYKEDACPTCGRGAEEGMRMPAEDGQVFTKLHMEQGDIENIVTWLSEHKEWTGADSDIFCDILDRLRDAKDRTDAEAPLPVVDEEENEDELECLDEVTTGDDETSGGNGQPEEETLPVPTEAQPQE